jgi:hypothetical protein
VRVSRKAQAGLARRVAFRVWPHIGDGSRIRPFRAWRRHIPMSTGAIPGTMSVPHFGGYGAALLVSRARQRDR